MHRPPPFQILHDLAKDAADIALRSISIALAQEKAAEQQLIMLQDYRQDYLDKMHTSMVEGIRSSQCRNTQNFINMLDDAVNRQAGVLGDAKQEVEQARAKWLLQRHKMTSMSALLERDKKKTDLIIARRDQKANDEFAARSFYRARAA